MILDPRESTVAYRCPICGTTILSVVGVFALSADRLKLKCSCGESELTVTYTAEKKIRISVPCILCGKSHSFVISEKTFFEKDVFTLSCPYTGIDICFIGKKDDVIAASEKADEVLVNLMKEAGLDSLERLHEENGIDDPEADSQFTEGDVLMFDVVNFLLRDLEEDHKITCRCKDGVGAGYQFKLVGTDHDTVLVFCDNCGASKSFPISDPIAANAFLHTDEIHLQ